MTNSVEWGIAPQRTARKEKFNFSAMTMVAIDDSKSGKGSGSNRKMSFNKAAIAALGLKGDESAVSFGFSANVDGSPKIFLRAVAPSEDKSVYTLNKGNAFSNKRMFEHISKLMNLDSSVEHAFKISSADEGIFTLELVSNDTVAVTPVETVVEDTVEDTIETVTEEVATPEADVEEAEGGGVSEW